MNILCLDRFTKGNRTGRSVHIYEIISNLSKLGHEIVLLNRDYRDDDGDIKPENQTIRPVRGQKPKWHSWPLIGNLNGEIAILAIWAAEMRTFAIAFMTIVTRHKRFDVIYRRSTAINFSWVLSRFFKIPLVIEVNGIITDELKKGNWGDAFSQWVFDNMGDRTIRKADRIITVTPKLKDILSTDFSIQSDKITVIQNGVNTDIFQPMDMGKARETLSLSTQCNYICFVGNLLPWQGLEHAIRSMPSILNAFPNTQLLIVGNGPMRQELTDLARQIAVIDNVIFVGEIHHYKVPLYINASDICIALKCGLRSGYSPLKLCEYMACKKIVVASRDSGLELVEESHGGFLVDSENVTEITEVICKLLRNKELRQQMGENGWKFVLANLSWTKVAGRVLEVFNDAVHNTP